MNSPEYSIGLFIGIIILLLLKWVIGLYLWGFIAVAIFGLPSLTAGQFLGLIVLIQLIFPITNPISMNGESK